MEGVHLGVGDGVDDGVDGAQGQKVAVGVDQDTAPREAGLVVDHHRRGVEQVALGVRRPRDHLRRWGKGGAGAGLVVVVGVVEQRRRDGDVNQYT